MTDNTTGSLGGLPPTSTSTPSAAKSSVHDGFTIGDVIAHKKVTIEENGEKKTFRFKVYFPKSVKTEEDKIKILTQFPQDRAETLVRQARELGLGGKFKQISMTFEKEQMREIKGITTKRNEIKTLSDGYLEGKVTKYKKYEKKDFESLLKRNRKDGKRIKS